VQGLEVDFERRLVRKAGAPDDLSATELNCCSNSRSMLRRRFRELLTAVWGQAVLRKPGYLRLWISRLRQKLANDGAKSAFLKNGARVGYMLDPAL